MNALNLTAPICNSRAPDQDPKANHFFTDKQKAMAEFTSTIFAFIGTSYLDPRHLLANRINQDPLPEANLNFHLERAVSQEVEGAKEMEKGLDTPSPFAHLSVDIGGEIFFQLEYDSRVQLVSKQWLNVFQRGACYKKLFQSYRDSPHLSALCTPIQAQPHLTDKEKIQALYQAVIDLTLRTEDGESAKQETASLYPHTLSAKRLSRLVRWTQAANLVKVFTKIADSLPTAQTFLAEIKEKDVLVQAEEMRLWMNSHPTELANITALDLRSSNLSELPKEMGQLTQLRLLDLTHNQLTTLPAAIGQLTQLQKLWLNSNRLTTLPAEIGQLTQLQGLWLNNNRLITLPAEIGQLTQLQRLWLNSNLLPHLPPEIGQLKLLQELQLSDNKLTILPAIGQLTQLRELWLNNNRLTSLPAGIGQLTQLQRLVLIFNQLNALPTEIGRLVQLQGLYLSKNKLTTLPVEIGQLTQLRELNLDSNRLTTLPTAIGQLTQLQELCLDSNHLTTLPTAIGQLTQLRELCLDNNQLTTLPAAIGQLTQLRELNLDNNPLLALPIEMRQLKLLRMFRGQNFFFSDIANIFASLTSKMIFWR